jgi:hypothetical protein
VQAMVEPLDADPLGSRARRSHREHTSRRRRRPRTSAPRRRHRLVGGQPARYPPRPRHQDRARTPQFCPTACKLRERRPDCCGGSHAAPLTRHELKRRRPPRPDRSACGRRSCLEQPCSWGISLIDVNLPCEVLHPPIAPDALFGRARAHPSHGAGTKTCTSEPSAKRTELPLMQHVAAQCPR